MTTTQPRALSPGFALTLALALANCGTAPAVPDVATDNVVVIARDAAHDTAPDVFVPALDAATDATTDASPDDDVDIIPGECNALTTDGAAVVTVATRTEPPPAFTGGWLHPGVYDLVAAARYQADDAGTPPAAEPLRMVLRRTPDALLLALDRGADTSPQRASWIMVTKGAELLLLEICPDPGPMSVAPYSVAGREFTFASAVLGDLVLTFRRRE